MQVCRAVLNWGVVLVTFAGVSYADDLPISRQVSTLTPSLIGNAIKVVPAPVPGASGPVLVTFRASEHGDVIDLHLKGGSPAMEQSARDALKQWKFKTFTLDGRPVQVNSAVVFLFSNGIATVSIPQPMSAQELSPRLQFPCSNGLRIHDPHAAEVCKKQLETVEKDKQSTPMERFTALDEYGLGLLEDARQPDQALQQFTLAINIAPDVLKESDSEWAYVYWHRATAEKQAGNLAESEKDLKIALSSMSLAEAASTGAARDYYRQMVEQIAAQQVQSPSTVPAQQP
jgi:hypothetical protein